jgi:hypothetical protein
MASSANFQKFAIRTIRGLKTKSFSSSVELINQMGSKVAAMIPVDTGNLKSTVRVVTDAARGRASLLVGGPKTTRKVRAGAAVDYDYAVGVEYGTQKMKAQPYFWPQWRIIKPKAKKRNREDVKQIAAAAGRSTGVAVK